MQFIFATVCLLLLLLQLVILAWSANEITIQSVNIAQAIFEYYWYEQSEHVKKILLIMIMRAQKPLFLSIGPFRPMNMQAGLMTLKASYTYSQVMKQGYS
ncbi:hypothetical protein ABEB36_014796 [Hypothenemus hampei]|uniref:Uncharacterized protein n=1 Tax=Hypothenemus hampei TaxID=57062 RepID=A0ABD1E0V6_HYPHA